MAKTYYITTPIYYVNDVPHIGHAYTTLACDVLARFMRLDGYDVNFLTGTDEHGQKVEKAAARAGVDPQTFTDRVSQNFRDLAKAMDISNDDFIRTTEERHKRGLPGDLAAAGSASGDIYLGNYAGWYAVRDEAFYGEDELTTGPDGKKRAPSGAEVEWVEEPSYFFRLSAWQDRLLEVLRGQPGLHRAARQRATRSSASCARACTDLSVSPHHLQLGRAGAGRPGAHHVCVARRADQLHHRRRLSRHRQRHCSRQVLAGRPAHGRQGHRALPRRLLAGLPDGGRPGAAEARVRPWLVDDRRPEDVEVAGQRHRARTR